MNDDPCPCTPLAGFDDPYCQRDELLDQIVQALTPEERLSAALKTAILIASDDPWVVDLEAVFGSLTVQMDPRDIEAIVDLDSVIERSFLVCFAPDDVRAGAVAVRAAKTALTHNWPTAQTLAEQVTLLTATLQEVEAW